VSGNANSLDTSQRFGFQWDRRRELYPHYRDQFLHWIQPLDPEAFRDKDVLDAGCGMGRNTWWAAQLGARSITAIDQSELAVASAREVVGSLPGVAVRRESIYDIEEREAFDLCFCLGVIHHLEHPRRALERLVESLRPGGQLVVWLYGYEGNALFVRIFQLLHPLLRRMPPRLLHGLAHLLALPLFLLLKLPLPRSEYLASLAHFPYGHVQLIVHDQLVPEVAHYYKRAEVAALFEGLPVSTCEIHHNRGYSWTVLCRR
jgi:2-polyprenyl-3-methyl-5-hydroxy-6-metoxy-1,4-benzoquinol methylase